MAKALDIEGADKAPGASSKPGGPSQGQEDQANDGKAFQSVLDTGDASTLKLAAVKAYPVPPIKGGAPQSLTKFQANFGQANGQMQKIRSDARKEIATATDPNVRRALLNAGAATPGELLKGEMVVNGVKVPITPADLDIWKTMVFTSTTQFVAACNGDPDTVYAIAEKYGVTADDFEAWVKQQGLLLKVNGL